MIRKEPPWLDEVNGCVKFNGSSETKLPFRFQFVTNIYKEKQVLFLREKRILSSADDGLVRVHFKQMCKRRLSSADDGLVRARFKQVCKRRLQGNSISEMPHGGKQLPFFNFLAIDLFRLHT
jgi:hypothetical protein